MIRWFSHFWCTYFTQVSIVFIIVSMKPYLLFLQCLGYYSAHQGWSMWITEKMATFFFCAEIEARSSLLYGISFTLPTFFFLLFCGWNQMIEKLQPIDHWCLQLGLHKCIPIIIRLGEQGQKELDKALREETRFFASCIFFQILFVAFW